MLDAFVDLGAGLRRWRTSWKLALQDIELRYKRSLLGPFWLSGTLVATMLALAYLFSGVFQQQFAHYLGWIGTGLLTWGLVTALTQDGSNSITEHGGLLQNVRLPLTTIAARVAIRNGIIFAHNAIAVLVTLLLFGHSLDTVMLMAIPGAAIIVFFGFFLCLAIGPLCTRFRDIPLVIQSVMQVIFFLTPIFWLPDGMSHRPIFTDGNPFYHLIQLVRAPMLGEWATAQNWRVALGCCAAAMFLAMTSVTLTRRRINLWL